MAENIAIENFSFDQDVHEGKHAYFLEMCPPGSGEQLGIPLMIANGRKPGKTLVAFAAVHGDELEGVQAIQDVFGGLDTDEMRGRFVAVPVANLPAFRAVQRTSPIDSLNLARTFPGRKDGSITERIAYYLGTLVIPQADLFIDLHSASSSLMPTMAGYDASGTEAARVSKEAAFSTGMPVVWGHPDLGPGRSLSAAHERGIPWLYIESPSGRRVSEEVFPYYVEALQNLLGYLKVIDRVPVVSKPKLHLFGSGDVDRTQSVRTGGFFVQRVRLLDRVEKGTLVGEVRDLFGGVLEEIRTTHPGIVAVLRANPIVYPGDPVSHVVEEVS